MSKIPIFEIVDGVLELQNKGEPSTLLGIGPMSPSLIQATLELSRDMDFPVMFIASRNQVDMDELGGGYVNAWNQERFAKDIRAIAEKVNHDGNYYLCRDHGGPWQRDKERNDHLPKEEAMEKAKQSYTADLKAGFDLLMIDPTKDPFQMGKVVPLEDVINMTVELIEYCEEQRVLLGLDPVGYEVGTEETFGGLTSPEKYTEFIDTLTDILKEKDLPMPSFIVGQTGTLTRETEQVGKFDHKQASILVKAAKAHNVGLKEHNADYLDDVSLLMHTVTEVTAINVAPQYGTEETRAYVRLTEVEKRAFEAGYIGSQSNLFNVILEDAIESERWRKWMTGDEVNLTVSEIKEDRDLSLRILDIAGHYTFNNERVKKEISVLSKNLAAVNIDVERYVINCIKRPIRDYAEAFNLQGLTSKIKSL